MASSSFSITPGRGEDSCNSGTTPGVIPKACNREPA